MDANGIRALATVLASDHSALKLPFPDSCVVSERMLNLSYLFGETRNYAAESCFKSLAEEVAKLERDQKRLVEQHQDALTLLDGWIESRSPAKYKAEHRADLDRKIAVLKEIANGR